MKYTPEPWQQGRLLLTPQTKRWSDDERQRAEEAERHRLFVNFTYRDQGQSRRAVACFERRVDAERAMDAVNAMTGIPDEVLRFGKTFVDPVERLREMLKLADKERARKNETETIRAEVPAGDRTSRGDADTGAPVQGPTPRRKTGRVSP